MDIGWVSWIYWLFDWGLLQQFTQLELLSSMKEDGKKKNESSLRSRGSYLKRYCCVQMKRYVKKKTVRQHLFR